MSSSPDQAAQGGEIDSLALLAERLDAATTELGSRVPVSSAVAFGPHWPAR